jgi:hypothetical protein
MAMLRTPMGRALINPAHVIRIHVARNRAPEAINPWTIKIRLTDGWLTWATYQTESEARRDLLRLETLLH